MDDLMKRERDTYWSLFGKATGWAEWGAHSRLLGASRVGGWDSGSRWTLSVFPSEIGWDYQQSEKRRVRGAGGLWGGRKRYGMFYG